MHDPYAIDLETKLKVKSAIKSYYADLTEIEEMNQAIEEWSYDHITSVDPEHVAVSPTNSISRPTETTALAILSVREKLDRATNRTRAVEEGITRAANTTTRIVRAKSLRQDLFDHLVNKVPREEFTRDTRTLTKYKKRAYYFIAEELGLLIAD